MKALPAFAFTVFLLFCLSIQGCGQTGGSGSAPSAPSIEETWSWDSTAEGTAVTALPLEAFEIFPVDLDELFQINNPTQRATYQQQFLSYGSYLFLSPFSMHAYLGNHTEGRGKWYYGPYAYKPVFMPGRGIITQKMNSSLLSASNQTTISGESVYSDTPLNIFFSKYTIITFGHLNILASIKNELSSAADGYIEVQAGQKIGYSGEGGEFQIIDGSINNGISSERHANMNLYSCPLQYFSPSLRATIESYYQTYIYDYIKANAKIWPQSKIDSPLNINVTDEVWGAWYYKSGLSITVTDEGVNWHNMGIVALLSWDHYKIDRDTFDPTAACPNPTIPTGYQFVGIYNDMYDFHDGSPYYEKNYLYAPSAYSSTEGAFIMIKAGTPDQGAVKYLKYKVYLNDQPNKLDNKLYLGIGISESLAESAFNSSPTIYTIDAKRNIGYPTQSVIP